MSSVIKADSAFVRQFLIILGALVAFTVVIVIAARGIGGVAFEHKRNDPAAIEARIAPVGEVRIAGSESAEAPAEAQPSAPAAPVASARSGADVYNSVCMACHMTGAAGAPKVGDKAAWQPRAAQGLDALVASAIKGKGVMPPKGGNPALGDAEIHAAVAYMLEQTGIEGDD